MQKYDCKKKSFMKSAFTLVEILIVICIILILFVVLVSRVDFSTDKARTTGAQSDLRSLQMAVHQIALEDGKIIDDINLLSQRLNKNLDSELSLYIENNQLKTHHMDPWGTQYQLVYSKPSNTLGQITISSAGPDMNFNTDDDIVTCVTCEIGKSGTNVIIGNNNNGNNNGEHICVFNQNIKSDQYIAFVGNCITKQTYYYSCTCGAKGTDIFDGDKIGNNHVNGTNTNYIFVNDTIHRKDINCVGCNTVLTSDNEVHVFINHKCVCNAEEHVHEFTRECISDQFKLSDATCTSPAIYYYSCSCNAVYTETFFVGDPLGHNYQQVIVKEPTCTTTGTTRLTCSRCSHSYEEMLSTKQHEYHEVVHDNFLFQKATCTESAKYYMSCICKTTDKSSIFINGSPLGHQYSEATCTAPQTCLRCQTTNGIANGHHEEFVGEKDVHSQCSICKTVLNTEHAYTSNITKEPTCTQTGIETFRCNCTYQYEISIDIISHVFNQENTADIYKKSHATCTQKALYYYSCSCGEKGTNTFEYGSLEPHDEVNGGTPQVHFKCSVCNKTLSATHSYTSEILIEATCTTKGTTKYNCLCGYSYTLQNIKMKSHTFDQAIQNDKYFAENANCLHGTYYYYSCVCGAQGTNKFEVGNPVGEHVEVWGGTSSVHTKCSVCSTTLSSEHNYITITMSSESTCSTKGYNNYKCECGYSKRVQDRPLLDCIWDDNGICTICGMDKSHMKKKN